METLTETNTTTKTDPKLSIAKYIEEIPQDTIMEYSRYWKTIEPVSDDDYYKRWLFAFLSVHTSWKANLKGYIQLTKEPAKEKLTLRQQIQMSSVGLIEMRTTGIWKFKEDFYKDPQSWRKQDDESWVDFRNRTMNNCHGLGFAKTAFAIEMCYPNTCEVTCLDTHMLQLYEAKGKGTPSPKKYLELEKHWVDSCKEHNISPFIARNVYWDKIQSQRDSRYWSSVFEKETNETDKQQVTSNSNQEKQVISTDAVLV